MKREQLNKITWENQLKQNAICHEIILHHLEFRTVLANLLETLP